MNAEHRTRINALIEGLEKMQFELEEIRGFDDEILEGMTEEAADMTVTALNKAKDAILDSIIHLEESTTREVFLLKNEN